MLLLGCENAVEKNATTEMEQGLRLVERHKGHYEGYSPQKKRLFSMADMIDAARQLREIQISDPHRPTYHFINPEGRGMPFDPNGSIYWNGKYHMFYIIQDERGHVYGHASSKDLMHWFYHTPAIFSKPEDPDKGIYSGNAFITREGKVAMIYHGVDAGNSIALSDHEELLHWEKLKNNPIIPEPEPGSKEEELYSSWDPNGWLENDTYYAIFGGKIPTIFKAKELDSWEYVGPFFSQDMPDVDIEVEDLSCPDLFKLGNKHAVLGISHSHGARIYIGEWRDEQFHPESHQRMNWLGGTAFAPESMLDKDGRRIMWAWVLDRREVLHLRYDDVPPKYGWTGILTLPRVLSLNDNGLLNIEPLPELNSLRFNKRSDAFIDLDNGSSKIMNTMSGNTIKIEAKVNVPQSGIFGMKVLSSGDGQEETVIKFNTIDNTIEIDFENSSLDTSIKHFERTMGHQEKIATKQVAPFELKAGEILDLQIFIDKSIIEVFANGRQCVTQRVYPTLYESQGVEVFSEKGGVMVESITTWDIAPTNHW